MNFIFIRRSLLLATLALVAGAGQYASAQSASPRPFTREAMLRDIAAKIIAPGCEDLAAKCRALTNAIGRLAEAPDQTSLDQARQAWIAAADAASRIRCFQAGPMAEREDVPIFYYPRVSPPKIEGTIKSSRAFDQTFVDEIGADDKGLFALEYLLFGHKGYPGIPTPNAPLVLQMLSGNDSQRRHAYLLAVARDVETRAGQLAKDWAAPGERDAAAKFAAGGQASVNLLVNQLAGAIEDAGQNHLNFVLVLRPPITNQLYRVERSPSGSSLEGAVAYLEGIQKIYRGDGGFGLADAVNAVNAPLAKRLSERLDAAIEATKAIGEPLEQAAVDKRDLVQKACDQVRALEILFKADLVSALGITLTFISTDGD